jgi:hypothetical protein
MQGSAVQEINLPFSVAHQLTHINFDNLAWSA